MSSASASDRRVVYYDHVACATDQAGFRSGDAGFVLPDAEWGFSSDVQVQVPPNALHALEEHGVVAQLNELEFATGPIRGGRDAVLRPASLDRAADILYEADRKTYGRIYEFSWSAAEGVEYRIVIDNRGYQRTLSQLQFLVTSAGRQGFGVRLRF